MAEEKVKITFEIDGIQQSVSSVDELQTALKGVDTQAQKTETSLDEAATAAKDLGKESKDAGKEGEAGVKLIDEATGGLGTRFKEVGTAFKTLGKSMKMSFKTGVKGASALKKGLIATGIGAIVVALGLIVAYWDDIIGAISGVSAAEKQLMEDTKAEVAAREDGLAATLASENSLKLAGKSEKEIRDLKIQQTNEVIAAMESQLLLQKEQQAAQVKAMERNKLIGQAVIGFLMAPITMLLAGIDALTAGLAYIGVLEEGTSLVADTTGAIADFIGLNPDDVQTAGDETNAETEAALAKLKNTRDGYILQGQASDQKAADTRKALKDQEAKDEEARLAKVAADAEALRVKTAAEAETLRLKKIADAQTVTDMLQQADLDLIQSAYDRAQAELEIQRAADIEKITLAGATADEIARINKQYDNSAKKLEQENTDFKKALGEADVDNALAAGSQVLGSIISLVGEGSAVGKAAAVAQTTIDTYSSATAAYKSTVGIPVVGPVLAPIAAGVAVAAGVMSVKKILSTKTPGKQGGGGGGGNISMPTTPAFDPTAALDQAAEGGQGNNTMSLDNQQGSTGNVIRAYVVSGEMTTQQEKDQKINDLARL
jgi:hypothetical protein|tara:strand:+ start:4826 stop:6634 length:1809 start_codon:yes stop_codon:yes gene_type:complete